MNRFSLCCLVPTLTILFACQILQAQVNEKTYFDNEGKTATASSADYYIIVQLSIKANNEITISGYYMSGAKKLEGNYIIKKQIENIDSTQFNQRPFLNIISETLT